MDAEVWATEEGDGCGPDCIALVVEGEVVRLMHYEYTDPLEDLLIDRVATAARDCASLLHGTTVGHVVGSVIGPPEIDTERET